MAIRSLIRVSLLGLVLGSLAVSAETWYLIANNAHADNPAAWTVMQYWKTADGTVGTTGEAVSSADDFVVKDGRVLRTGKYGASMTFPGKSLQLGDATTAGTFTHDGGSFTFARDGLTVYGGGIYYTNVGTTNNFLQGTQLRVMATAERPFVFDAQQALYSNSVMHVVAPVVGDAGTCLRFGRDNSVTCRTTHKLDDLTHYQGSIIVGNGKFPCEGECWGNKVLASSFSTPGMLRLADNGAAFGVLTNGTVCTAATVELAAGSRLMVEGAIGLVRATTTLSVAAGARICVGSTLSSSRVAVLEGPIASTFTAGDFVLETLEECANDDIALDVVADEVAGTKTLYLTCSPLVIQIRAVANEGMKDKMKNNVPGTYGSSMTNKSSWNDGELPHAGSAYYSGMSLRTPLGDVSNNTGDWAFPGDGLVLGRGSQFTLFQKNVTIDRLEMRNGGYMQTGQGSWHPTVHVPNGILVEGEARLASYSGQTLTLDGEISGSGRILCWGVDGTSAPAGGYAFTGLNTSFLGTICVSQRVAHATARPTLNLYDGRNLGGKLPAFEPRALWLDDNALVYLPSRNSSVTLPHDYNRGLYVRCAAEINVNDTSVLEIKQPILLAGHLGLVAGGRVILGWPHDV